MYPPQGPWLPPPVYQPPPPRPSSIPTVIGILMICFSGLGLLLTLIAMAATNTLIGENEIQVLGEACKKFKTYHLVEQGTYLIIGLLHMVAGILCVMKKRAAPAVAILYCALKIVAVVGMFFLVYTWLAPVMDKYPPVRAQVTTQLIFGSIFNLAWPIVAWALISRPSARAACNR